MPKRARGYHYVIRNGRRKRVYSGRRRYGGGGRAVKGRGAYRHARKSYNRRTVKGRGSYKMGRTIGMGNQAPIFKNSKVGVIIRHEEYLGDMTSTQGFINYPFNLNPGLTLVQGGFTNWLPQVALNFEQWKPRGMGDVFINTCWKETIHLRFIKIHPHI